MGKKIIGLQGEELRSLAKVVHYQEVESVKNIDFRSEDERRKYLDQTKACYASALGILDSGEKAKRDYASDQTRSPVAHQIFSCMETTVNVSIQCVRNYLIRTKCLAKATDYCASLIHKLHTLDPRGDLSGVLKLVADAREYEKALVQYASEHSNPVLSSFSNWIKAENLTFENLLIRYVRYCSLIKLIKAASYLYIVRLINFPNS